MRRYLSLAIACVMLLTSVCMLFSGCGSSAEAEDKMLVSEWLNLINYKFGFDTYTQTEPYLSTISSDNASFDDVQKAFEYSVLPEGYTAIDLNSELTREFCALTLSGAVYIKNTDNVIVSDADKLLFPESVASVLNYGIMELKDNGSFDPAGYVKYSDAVEYLDRAYYTWLNMGYENKIEGGFADEVVDLAGFSSVMTNDVFVRDDQAVKENLTWLQNNDYRLDDNGTVHLMNIADKGINEGSVLTLPVTAENPSGSFRKVESVIENADGSFDLKTSEAGLDDVYTDDFVYQYDGALDFSNCLIFDENGNIIGGTYGSDTGSISASPMSLQQMDNLNIGKMDIPFDLGGGLSGKVSLSSSKIDVSVTLASKSGGGSIVNGQTSTKRSVSIGKTFSNLKLTQIIPKNLKKGYLRLGLNYDTVDKLCFKASGNSEYSGDIKSWGKSGITKNEDGSMSREQINDYKDLLDIISMIKDENGQLAAAKSICSIRVFGNFGASVDLALMVRVSAEGSLEFALSYAGAGFGLEKRENSYSVRGYHDMGTKTNTSIEGVIKAEFTVGPNLSARLLNVNMADVECLGGFGAKLSGKANLVTHQKIETDFESPLVAVAAAELTGPGYIAAKSLMNTVKKANAVTENVENAIAEDDLSMLLCVDIKVYPILRLTVCSPSSQLSKFGATWSYEISGDKNKEFILKTHLEKGPSGFGMVDKCSLDVLQDEGLDHGYEFKFDPDSNVIELDVGETKEIVMKQIPTSDKKYYMLKDIRVETAEKTIAMARGEFKTPKKESEKADQKIIITGVSPGETVVTVKTKDGLVKYDFTVKIKPKDAASLDSLKLKTYSASVALQQSIKLTVEKIPEGQNEISIFWDCDDESIARVDPLSGEITGVSEGNATVSAHIVGKDDYIVYCLITVTKDYTSTVVSSGMNSNDVEWIKIEGLPVMIIEKV